MRLESVKHIGIVGCGMIGDSLSVLTTGHGYRTTCLVRNAEKIPKYQAAYESYFKQMADEGLMPYEQVNICKNYLAYTTDIADLATCDVIFECIVEDIEQKHALFARIEETCSEVKAICSVSSTIVPDVLAEQAGKYKDRIIVTHPFHPVHMVPFFELCGGSATGEGVIEFACELLVSLDRKPVVMQKALPGFIGNRLQFALWREALNLVESGVASPRDIDTCLQYSFCPRYTSIGIFEHFDNGGMLLNRAACDGIFPTLSTIESAPKAITERIERGDLGAKSGVGFYDWRSVDMDEYQARVNAPYWKFIDWDLPKE